MVIGFSKRERERTLAWSWKSGVPRWKSRVVRHGGVFVRVSPNKLQKANSSLADEEEKEGANSIKDKTDENKSYEEITEPT